MLMEKLWIKYSMYIVVNIVGCLYITDQMGRLRQTATDLSVCFFGADIVRKLMSGHWWQSGVFVI
jgi:hypothetical protein